MKPHVWKNAVRERAGEKCERCERSEDPRPDGEGTYRHHCHHKDRDRSNNTLANGEYLCGDCHDAEHGGTGKVKAWSESTRGHTFSDETRTRMGESKKGIVPWNKGRTITKGRVPWNKGRTATDDPRIAVGQPHGARGRFTGRAKA